MIGIAPSADFEAAAYPAKAFILAAGGPGKRGARGTAHSARLGCYRTFRFDRLLCQFQNLRGDDRFGNEFLFHLYFHYIPSQTEWNAPLLLQREIIEVPSMSDLAFLFPGQGSQFAGMGQRLAEEFPIARETFAEADEALGFALSKLCFSGPDEELKKTANTQPAIVATSTAAYRVLAELGHQPSMVAGHSLGEYSALVANGCLEFGAALRLVRARGQFMQDAVPEGVGAMAALLKLPEDKLDQVLQNAAQGEIVTAANFNSPDQIVIAGHAAAVERAMQLAKEAGAKRAIRLPVSAPFHCPLMLPAQEKLKPQVHATVFHLFSVPLINNWQARVVTDPASARVGLIEQIPNPVRWTESIRDLARHGITRFIEVGPGSVLLGLCRSINPSLRGRKFGEPADLHPLAADASA